MPQPVRSLLYGTGFTIAALALAWFLNTVFERSLAAIGLIVLAMVVVFLLQRMIQGAIPKPPLPPRPEDPKSERPSLPGDISRETAHLPGVDRQYGIMALPPAAMALVLLISIII